MRLKLRVGRSNSRDKSKNVDIDCEGENEREKESGDDVNGNLTGSFGVLGLGGRRGRGTKKDGQPNRIGEGHDPEDECGGGHQFPILGSASRRRPRTYLYVDIRVLFILSV